MATFIVLFSFTEQGIRNVKETINRADAFKEMAERLLRPQTARRATGTIPWAVLSFIMPSLRETTSSSVCRSKTLLALMQSIYFRNIRIFSKSKVTA